MKEAKLASERHHIEEAMLKDSAQLFEKTYNHLLISEMRMTDWERTEEELQRQVSYC